MIILKVIILAALVKLLIATNSPLLCAGIYTGIGFIFRLMMEQPFSYLAVASALSFVFAFIYFWLLDRFEESVLFWVIMVLGLVIGLV